MVSTISNQALKSRERYTLSTNSARQVDCAMMEYSNMSPCVNVRICISNSKAFLSPQGVYYSSLCLEINKPQIYTVEIDVFHKNRYNDDKYYSQQSVRLQQHPLHSISNLSPPLKLQCVEVIGGSGVASHHLSQKKQLFFFKARRHTG